MKKIFGDSSDVSELAPNLWTNEREEGLALPSM